MSELHWPRESTFADVQDGDTVRYGQGTHEIPEDRVDHYLARGWERPEADQADTAPEPATQETEPDAEADTEADADGRVHDAEGFVDDAWQAVTAAIEDGDVDEHLDAVREAEQDRDSPRDSVLNAIEERQG